MGSGQDVGLPTRLGYRDAVEVVWCRVEVPVFVTRTRASTPSARRPRGPASECGSRFRRRPDGSPCRVAVLS